MRESRTHLEIRYIGYPEHCLPVEALLRVPIRAFFVPDEPPSGAGAHAPDGLRRLSSVVTIHIFPSTKIIRRAGIILPVDLRSISCTGAFAQRRYNFRNANSAVGAEDPNYFSGTFALGGFGLGYSLGVECERILGQGGQWSIRLPVVFMRSTAQFIDVAGDGDRFHYHRSMFIAPGLLFHPAGAFRRGDFSMGLQFAAGPLNTREVHYTGGSTRETMYTSVFAAPMGQININIRGKYSNNLFGWQFAAGPTVAGQYGIDYAGRTIGNPLLVQVGIRIGGTF